MDNLNFIINILTTDGPQYDYLIHKLESKFAVGIVIRELGKYQRKRLIIEKKYYRYICNRYQWLARKILGYDKYRQHYFKYPHPLHSRIINVKDINSSYVINLLRKKPCNLYVVMGTSILKTEFLKMCNADIINIHGGYLPDYRGNNCIYFAYLNNDFQKIANTIHFIDKGIDTGDIIEIVRPLISDKDNPETLYCKAKKKAINRLVEIVNSYERGEHIPRHRQDTDIGKQYKTEERNPKTALIYVIKKIKLHIKKLISF
ncbi:MAG: formyl transferase [Lachnospiraceae bacterium]|nr:formyl transferase [Lachnospiraceae bacterium]